MKFLYYLFYIGLFCVLLGIGRDDGQITVQENGKKVIYSGTVTDARRLLPAIFSEEVGYNIFVATKDNVSDNWFELKYTSLSDTIEAIYNNRKSNNIDDVIEALEQNLPETLEVFMVQNRANFEKTIINN